MDHLQAHILLADLRDGKNRALLRAIWTDPHSLDPSKKAAEVTLGHPQMIDAAASIICPQ